MSEAESQTNLSTHEEEEVRWLWKATKETGFYQRLNDHGTRIGVGLVTLNSAEPLNYEQVKLSFYLVQRKCLNLRIALRNRNNDLWFCELPKADVDFEVLEKDANFLDEIEKSSKETFNCSNKPHWRVRLIPRSVDTSCILPEVKKNFPFQYDCFIQFNHNLLDGINAAWIINMSHRFLDDIISGKESHNMKPFGSYSERDGLEELEGEIKKKLQENPGYLEKLEGEFPSAKCPLWINKVYPRPEVSQTKTKHILRIMDSNLLKALRDKSKAAGVTFNSTFVGIINMAFIDMLLQGGFVEDSYTLQAFHQVNLRRYLGKSEILPLGSYNFAMSHAYTFRKSAKENFWEYVKDYHNDIQSKLRSGRPLEERVCKRLRKQPDVEEYLNSIPPAIADFCVTNMGDMTAAVPGEGRHVQVTDVRPFNFIHDIIHMINFHQIVTYRGQTRYTLSYDTSYLSDGAANAVMDRILNLLVEISHS